MGWLLLGLVIGSIGGALAIGLFSGRQIIDLQEQNRRLSRRVMEQRAADYLDRVGGD